MIICLPGVLADVPALLLLYGQVVSGTQWLAHCQCPPCNGCDHSSRSCLLSCVERTAAALEAVLVRNLATDAGPPLNAFQQLNPYALEQAAAFDRARAAGRPIGPLGCLPVALKDNVASFDQPMTAGSLALLGNQPDRDADAVARLRAAGAIVIGKTTMDEFAFGIRGLSGAAGRVGNAYNPWLSPGGSSSGSAVAVAAGFVELALGSDNCGSLRLPAV